jgi:TolB-like protein/Flp pilus assembly protein TadD
MSIWAELRRRNVYKVGASYAMVAWLLIQAASILLPTFGAPSRVMPVFTAVVILGFPVVLVLAWVYEITPHGIRRTDDVPLETSVARVTGRRLNYVITGLLSLALVFLAVDNYVLEDSSETSQIASVAVLPFEDLSGDTAQSYFVNGMTDALIATLAAVDTIRVTSRTSVMQFQGANASVADIAERLNVDSVVEGAVLRDGERVRITARLIDVGTDRPVWSKTYERELRDILSLQNDLARAITGEMRAALTPEESERLARNRVVDPDAYDAYLRARELFTRVNEASSLRAVELFHQAVALDPLFAAAHAELGLACMYVSNFHRPGEPEWEECARTAVEQALALDADAAEAYVVRGRLVWTPANGYPHEQAIRELQRAIALNPLLGEAHFQLGQVYGHVGLLDAYLDHARQAAVLDPQNSRFVEGIGQALLYQGRYQEALDMFAQVPVDMNQFLSGMHKAWALFSSGQKTEAETLIDDYLRNNPTDLPGTLSSMKAIIVAARGNREAAAQMIEAAAGKNRSSLQFHHTAYNIAVAHAFMDQRDEALEWLEYAAEDGFPCLPLFEHDENLRTLRTDPRFAELIARFKGRADELKALAAGRQ